jgi:hypothetical protein
MDQNWINHLKTLSVKSKELEEQQLSFLTSHSLSSNKIYNNSNEPFYIDNRPIGQYLKLAHFDFKKYFNIEGNASLYYLRPIFHGLLFYDTIILPLYPCDKNYFTNVHDFEIKDFPKIIDLCHQKKIIFFLTQDPLEYAHYSYLEPIFKEINPLQYPLAPNAIMTNNKGDRDFDKLTDSVTEIPNIKRALQRYANTRMEKFEITEIGFISAIQLLHYWGYKDLYKFIWDLLFKNPFTAIDLAFAIKRLVVNPSYYLPQFSHATSFESTYDDFRKIGQNIKIQNISFPGEIGALFQNELSFPCPNDWEGLRWCNENLDIKNVKKSFSILDSEITTHLNKTPEVIYNLKGNLNECWHKHLKESTRIKKMVYWGSSLSLGALGTLVTGPLIGLLTAFGLTASSNILLEPFSEYSTKKIARKSYHLWKTYNSMGRK